jgi:hypothetical protein
LKERVRKGKKEILVKWKGYDDSQNEWIDAEDVVQS